jgi:hypothetical protein
MYSALRRDCAFHLSATHVSRLANPRLQCSVGGGVSDARAEKLCPLWVLGQDDGEFTEVLQCCGVACGVLMGVYCRAGTFF